MKRKYDSRFTHETYWLKIINFPISTAIIDLIYGAFELEAVLAMLAVFSPTLKMLSTMNLSVHLVVKET